MRLIYIASLAVVGCVADGADTEQTEQAVTQTALNSFTCSAPSGTPCNFDLGTATNRTCVIAGIRGAIGAGQYGGFVAVGAGDSSENSLTIFPSTGFPLTVNTVCVTPAAHKITAHWEPGFGSVIQIPNTNAATRCFLSQVTTAGDGGLTHTADFVRTYKGKDGNWWLGGVTTSGFVDANAVCFDVATAVGSFSLTQQAGSITSNLSSNLGGGVACGLTYIGGIFTTNSQTDGISIDFAAQGAGQWFWTLVNFKTGIATCFK